MVEVVFGDSAAGGLACAMGRGRRLGGVFGVAVREGGGRPSREEARRIRREAEERGRRDWAEAVPLEGRREDVIALSLLLSAGDIREEGVGPGRAALLRELEPDLPEEDLARILEKSRRGLAAALERAGRGEPVRIWTSRDPDEACGACWLLEQLRPLGFDRLEAILLRLPEFQVRPDGVVVRYRGWGEVHPSQLGRLAQAGEALPPNALRMMADRWRELREENAPLRALVNGQLVSAPETLYDPWILREIRAQEEAFREAVVIANIIGRTRLGLGDGWIARRIEGFVRQGLLEVVTPAAPGGPGYRRVLRKRGSFWTQGGSLFL